MNNVTICGYLGKDFELVMGKTTYAKTSIGITESREKDGEVTKHTNWIPIIIFGKRAEVAYEYLKKGDRFLGSGKIHTQSYEKDGVTNYSWQVIINNFEFIHNKKETTNFNTDKKPQINIETNPIIDIADDEIPF